MIENDTITGLRLDIARLEGMLTAFLSDGLRRIEGIEKSTDNLRNDLTSVKDNCRAEIAVVANTASLNAQSIKDIRDDIKEVNEKMNGSLGRASLIISPLIAVLALLWNVLGK